MERTLDAPAASAASGERPGWWTTLWTMVLAGLLSIPLLIVTFAPLVWLGVIPAHLTLADPADSASSGLVAAGWPWLRDGWWEAAASVWPALLHGGVYAFALAWVAKRRGGWHVHPLPLLIAFVLAAPAPGWADEAGAFFWLVLWVVVQQWGLQRSPADPRWNRATAIAAGATAVALAVATLSYQPLHPLSAEAREAGARTVAFRLEVDGAAGARLLSLRTADQKPLGRFGAFVVRFDDPATLGRRLSRGTVVTGHVVMPRAWCSGGNWAQLSIDSLIARVAVLGAERTQRIALARSVPIGCRAS